MSDHYDAVQQAVAGALGLGEDEVTPDATLMDDLGAESIDLLDILFRVERATGVKISASELGDEMQGGISDEEFGTAVEYVHTLGPGLYYFVNEFTGKVNFGNGVAADATHQMLLGKDSPQVATRLSQTATTTRWSVASGGRMGGVLALMAPAARRPGQWAKPGSGA